MKKKFFIAGCISALFLSGCVVAPYPPYNTYNAHRYGYLRAAPDYRHCAYMSFEEQIACERGAEHRAQLEQTRLNQEAYKRGYQGY